MPDIELTDELFNVLNDLAASRNLGMEDLLRQLLVRDACFENALNGIFIANDEMQYVDVNPAICNLLGYNRDEILSMDINDISFREDPQDEWDTFIEEQQLGGQYVLKHKDGHPVFVRYTAVTNIINGLHASIMHDMTEKKELQSQLRQSQNFVAEISNNIPGLIYQYDVQNKQDFYINDQIFDFLGYTPVELHTMTRPVIEAFIHPADQARFFQHHHQLQQSQTNQTRDITFRVKHKNGNWSWLQSYDSVTWRPNHKSAYITGVAVDITNIKQMQLEVQMMLDRSPIAVGILTMDGQLEYFNPIFTNNFGYTLNDLPDIETWWTIASYKTPEEHQSYLSHWNKYIDFAENNNGLMIHPARQMGRKSSYSGTWFDYR